MKEKNDKLTALEIVGAAFGGAIGFLIGTYVISLLGF